MAVYSSGRLTPFDRGSINARACSLGQARALIKVFSKREIFDEIFSKKIEKGGEKEYSFEMNLTRRKKLLIVWAASIITVGILVCRATGVSEYGWAASLSLLAISLGVPLMRAFTEFSK